MALLKDRETKDSKSAESAAGLVTAANERFAAMVTAKGGVCAAAGGDVAAPPALTRLASAVCRLDPREAQDAAWGPTIDQLAEAWVSAGLTTWGPPPEGYVFTGVVPGGSGVRLLWSYDVSADVWLGRFDIFGHP
jgi:hypothetical protein